MNNRRHLLVSCVFGPDFKYVYKAVPNFDNALISNNPALRDHVQAQGWDFVLVEGFPLSSDVMVSSLQAKWAKFLQFLDAIPGYNDVTSVTYYDHKFEVLTEHIEWIARQCAVDRDILIRETPRLKLSISDEIRDAMGQERYVRHMPETLALLNELESSGRISRNVRIVNTGFIHYRNLPVCKAFTQEIYNTCIRLNQPECQIIWAALAQMSRVRIQQVPWKSLEPLWKEPTVAVMRESAVVP